MSFRYIVWYSPVLLVVDGHCWAWFWRSRATMYHRRSTCDSPAMLASQGNPLGDFQGSFGWIGLLGWVQQVLQKFSLRRIYYQEYIELGKESYKGMFRLLKKQV